MKKNGKPTTSADQGAESPADQDLEGDTEDQTPESQADGEPDWKALYEAQRREAEAIRNESIKRKNRLKELEKYQAEQEEAKKQAERAKMDELQRLEAEKKDYEKALKQHEAEIKKRDQELFNSKVELSAAKLGAKNSKYINYRVSEHLATLESKEDFDIDNFINDLKNAEPDQFGSGKAPAPGSKETPAPKPAAHTSSKASDTPPESGPYEGPKIGRITTIEDSKRLNEGWDQLDAMIAGMSVG